jgi:mono/diheme cytochrome c family protein
MKSRVTAIFLAMCSLVMVAGMVYADLKKGYYSPAELGSLRQPAPSDLSPNANYQVSAYPVPDADLAPGDGRQEVQIYCNTCHSPRYITMQPPLPAATWEAEVNKMNKTFGAAIPDDSAQKIILYLRAHYTVENRKP